MLRIKQFTFNPFAVSTYVVYDTDTRQAMVIDPGMSSTAEHAAFDSFIANERLTVTQVVNTHLHLDHCFGDNYVRDKYGVKVAASPQDSFLGESLAEQMQGFGIRTGGKVRPVHIDVPLADGDTIALGDFTFEVLAVPGHTPGGIALYCAKAQVVFAGDSLFRGSIGRTDLPGGDFPTLVRAIKNKLFSLPDSTAVFPGHNGSTDIGNEKRSNPYLRDI